MLNNIILENNYLLLPTLFSGVFLLVLFVWKESKRDRKKFIFNVLVGVLAIANLALIVLKPAYLTPVKSFQVALLTEGYRNKTLDSLKENDKDLKIIDYQKGKNIFNSKDKPTQLYVLGHGVATFDLWQLDSIPTTYIFGEQISGITRLKYNSIPNFGEPFLVKGLYNLPKEGNKLFLVNPVGKNIDSVLFFKADNQEFTLSSTTKVSGKLLYSLVEKDSLNTIVKSNPLPIEVQKKEPLKILIINSFPTFETKYLKNFLTERNHKVLVRNQITKGKFKLEFFNTTKEKISFSKTLLSTLDVLIIDVKSLINLSKREKNSLKHSIENEGLGVFIQPDTNLFLERNSIINFNFLNTDKDFFIIDGVTVSKYKYSFKNDPQLESIHKKGSVIYSGYKFIGNGKIGSTVAQQTYEMILSGNENFYQKFWSKILSTISKKAIKESSWKNINQFSVIDEPFSFELITNFNNPTVFSNKKQEILLAQDINQKFIWRGKLFPKNIGWHQLNVQQDSLNTFSFYTLKNDDYSALKAYNTYIANKRLDSLSDKFDITNTKKKPINLIWFYVLFLLCMAYLWLIPKL